MPSPAGLSGSLWGVQSMQADGESATCRPSSLRSVALTLADYMPAVSLHLLGTGNMTPQRKGPVSRVEPSERESWRRMNSGDSAGGDGGRLEKRKLTATDKPITTEV